MREIQQERRRRRRLLQADGTAAPTHGIEIDVPK
jgi:hypothetical protein